MDSILEKSLTTIDAAIATLNYFDKQFPLSTLVQADDAIYPAHYCGKGQYDRIDFDKKNGVSYWRKVQNVSTQTVDGDISCRDVLQISYPMRLVGAIPKNKLSADDAYSEERVIQTILGTVTGSNKTIKAAIKANSVFIIPSSFETEMLEIVKTEYSLVKAINYNMAYFRIDFDLIIQIREDCIPKECD